MQKSLYQDPTFASYWNDRAGDKGEVFKQFVTDPLMFELMGDISGKVLLDLGCGNGYLGPAFIAQNPRQVIMMDISAYNLQYAAKRRQDNRCTFLEQDATKAWKVKSNSVDVVFSSMMLNEVEDIHTPISETYRNLKNGGLFVFSVTHPAWDLYVYAQEKVGTKSQKIKGLGGYFDRKFTHFIMGEDSSAKSGSPQKFAVEHYHRPIADYFTQLTKAGFRVDSLLEPELTNRLIEQAPRFAKYRDYPIGLVFSCVKDN